MVKNLLAREREYLLARIQELTEKVRCFPKEDLLCVKNGNYVKWVKCDGRDRRYLSKSEKSTAQQLAAGTYYRRQLRELKRAYELLEHFEVPFTQALSQENSLLEQNPGFQELLRGYWRGAADDTVARWLQEEYAHNLSHPETLIHETVSGIRVRSKSEVMIANTLFTNQIPFRYECALDLGAATVYPDFTILNPVTREICYWEHFGMMGDSTYRDNAFNKLKLYGSHNIIPSINLITTYETLGHPLSFYRVEELVQAHFLSL